jgi:hypothetical protein
VRTEPLLENKHEYAETTYQASLGFLRERPALLSKVADNLWAYHEAVELVPVTVENFVSGHTFPCLESYEELEASYDLALQGFYRYAFGGLRSCLELGVLGVYFAVDDKEHVEVKPWMLSQERTPWLKDMLRRLHSLVAFNDFDRRFGLADRMLATHDRLSGYVHTRGYPYSSRGLKRSNVNNFQEAALRRYSSEMFAVVRDVLTTMLLKYPVGMRALPVSEKYGLNGPAGGFLEDYQVEAITSVLIDDERDYLQSLSDGDEDVRAVIEHFESMADLSPEEWEQQIQDFRAQYPATTTA